jgi:glycosyltransferase involved in cell wall biosynthesis
MVPIWMNACSLHLMTSDLEGSPNSIKECLMCNVPIVSTDVGNVREMVEDIPGTYVTDSFSEEELAECVHKVLMAKEEFEGRKILMAKGYGINEVGQSLFKLYNEVVYGKK